MSTATGGSANSIKHARKALEFLNGDAGMCAAQVCRLMEDSEWFSRIRHNARQTVEERFSLEVMLTKIESSLAKVVTE